MTHRPRVIHTAQALADLVIEVQAIPERGGNVVARSAREYAGGAVNVLVAAARSGAAAVHAGAHGTGRYGDLIRAALRADAVALSDAPVPEADSGVCVVLVEPSGERTFVTTYGAERQISTQRLSLSAPAAGDYLLISGYSLDGPTRDPLLDWLDTIDPLVQVVLDPGAAFAGLADPVRSRVLGRANVWTSNAEEARELAAAAGIDPAPDRLATLLPDGAIVVVRDGERGCEVYAGGVSTAVAGYPRVAVDTNGAGDAHVGVMVAELAAGLDPVAAARRANAAGAIKVTRRGPATAPTRAEIDTLVGDEG